MSRIFYPPALLRFEGAVLLISALLAYGWFGGNWWLFALLLLSPDLAMLAYVRGPRVGAAVYNLFHIYLLPAALAVTGTLLGRPLLWQLALIWFAHLGMDRLMGYGLKYPTAFKDTHLQR